MFPIYRIATRAIRSQTSAR